MALFFYLFSFLLILGSIGVIMVRNPVSAVLCLIFTFCQAAGIFLLLGAEFIAMTLIIVYVGAVAVLFLFTVMMLDLKAIIPQKIQSNMGFLKFILCVGLILDVTIIISMSISNYTFQNKSTFLMSTNQESNTQQIGKILYTDFFLAFQLSGLILFLAMIGCVVLTLKKDSTKKKSIIYDYREKRSVTMANPKINEGVSDE